jgi:hypothetical protein
MGLDIYLYTRQQQDADAVCDKAHSDYWEEWGDKPDSPEKTAAHEAIPAYEGSTDVPSEHYPNHLFNRRYLRSSYNAGGFNRAVPDIVGEDHGLYWIFKPIIGHNAEPYETELTTSHLSSLEDVKKRALQVADEIRQSNPLRTETATGMIGSAEHMWQELPDENQVLEWYRSEKAGHIDKLNPWGRDDYSYSNAKGTVLGFNKGVEVLAVTLGKSFMGPAAVFVYRLGDEAKESYVQSAEIVAEFCDEAVDLINKDGSCFMHWSG